MFCNTTFLSRTVELLLLNNLCKSGYGLFRPLGSYILPHENFFLIVNLFFTIYIELFERIIRCLKIFLAYELLPLCKCCPNITSALSSMGTKDDRGSSCVQSYHVIYLNTWTLWAT